MDAYDFEKATAELQASYGENTIRSEDVLSHALYPDVFTAWRDRELVYGNIQNLPTHIFLKPMKIGEEVRDTEYRYPSPPSCRLPLPHCLQGRRCISVESPRRLTAGPLLCVFFASAGGL